MPEPFPKTSLPILNKDHGIEGISTDEVVEEEEGPFNEPLLLAGNQKYRLIRPLAEGGSGILYEAEDLNTRRTVAMKVLLDDLQKTPEELTEFIEEAQITARLEHPNIIPIYDVGLDDTNRIYYTMKLIRGKSLTDILIGLRKKDPEMLQEYRLVRLLNIFQKVCDAVAFAHARLVLHCDLKPDNIMIAEYGEVLVVDWGLARRIAPNAEHDFQNKKLAAPLDATDALAPIRQLHRDEQESGLKTMSGHIVGTPGFMAPERIDSKPGPLKVASDIYSLGAILYSLLSLRPPLKISTYKTQLEMLQAIRENVIQPPINLNQPPEETSQNGAPATALFPHCPEGRIPDALSRITMHALAKEPDKRYQSVLELQQDIEAYQNGTCWQVVGDYDMSDPASIDYWDVYGGQCERTNTGLRVFGGRPQILLLRQEVPGDVRIESECHIQSVNLDNLGCFISAINGGNKNGIPFSGYEFSYGAFNNSIIQLSRADHKLWSRAASPLHRNVPFHIVAERSGNTLSLTVNDQGIFNETDTDPLSGGERTAVGLYSWETDICYKRITVYARGVPWHADILDIAERQLQKGHYGVAKAIYTDILDSQPNEKRLLRARAGLEKTDRREQRDADVRKWQRMLEEAWPGANPKLSMVNDELSVEVTNAAIDDLAPLIGLPITTLYCQSNRIRSLEPLRGMRLELLSCSDNPIESLEPLAGMPLRSLYSENCPVSTLEPLRGVPLTLLNVGGARFIETLEPLVGMKLVFFSCWGNKISTLEPLRGMPLAGLFCGNNELTDLEPLRGMPIRMLQISGNRFTDLAPLEDVKLTWLHCANNHIEELTPLRHSDLVLFSCQGNRIRDLAPLEGMDIATVTCGNNLLKDIGHLRNNPPRDFAFDCETIPTAALQDMLEQWRTKPEWAHHAEHAATLLALRKGRIRELFDRAHPYEEHRYLFIPRFMTWQAAADFCRSLQGTLLTILSPEENNFVARLFPNGCWIWLGLAQTDDGLQWITGEALSYHNFTDPIQRNKTGRKTFNGSWCSEDIPGVENCFVIKWRNNTPPNDTHPSL